ncbi:hypothetical protein [Nocardia brevicatena]|uniref:hypothetical protein n=1 Tax=Nocardia brevicatena TaxID=37327 RepID=UPI000307E3BC|nr:hypothetical protein [Nocardia brevicatena]
MAEQQGVTAFSVPQDGTVTQLLEIGSRGLLYFEYFEPRYRRYVKSLPPGFLDYAALHERFYQQNGMSEDKIRNTADTLKQVLESARTQHGRQQTLAQRLPSIWSGDAATAASDMLATQLSMAESDITAVQHIWEALDKAPQELRKAVRDKAEIVLQILENGVDIKIDGKSVEDVDTILAGAEGLGPTTIYSTDSAISKLERIFPDLREGVQDRLYRIAGAGILGTGSRYDGSVKNRCRHWLDNVFKPDYERKTALFVDMCKATDDLVNGVYGIVISAFEGLSEAPYPCPQVTPRTQTSQQPQTQQPRTPSTGIPTDTGTPVGTDTPTVPSTTQATTTDNPLSTLSSLGQNALSTIEQLGTQAASMAAGIGQGLEQLMGTVDQDVGDTVASTLEQLRAEAEKYIDTDGDGTTDAEDTDDDGDGTPDDSTDAGPDKDEDKGDGEDEDKGLELAGRQVKLEMGPDGQLKLMLTDAAGKTEEYKVELDESGKPVLVGEESPNEQDDPAITHPGEQPTESGGTRQQPTGPQGPPTGRKDEDGEYQPQFTVPHENQPEPEPEARPPAPPAVDAGARLAEAGPL